MGRLAWRGRIQVEIALELQLAQTHQLVWLGLATVHILPLPPPFTSLQNSVLYQVVSVPSWLFCALDVFYYVKCMVLHTFIHAIQSLKKKKKRNNSVCSSLAKTPEADR